MAQSCRAKAAVVVADEREDGDRALLNLGHTFGHALERVTGYDAARLVHGEGVAIGMALAFRFSARLGLCGGQDAERVEAHLRAVGLPTRLADVPGGAGRVEAFSTRWRQDKKVKARRAHLHPGARHRAELRRARRRGRRRPRLPGRREWSDERIEGPPTRRSLMTMMETPSICGSPP